MIPWENSTLVEIVARTPTIKSFYLSLPRPVRFVAGQHLDVRLTAPDGYQAERSYSIATAPEHPGPLELAIERLEEGEVSTFFHDVAEIGDPIEVRGPIGGHFVWKVEDGGPLLLIGGGSGVVPLMSMLRHHAARDSAVPILLLYSVRTTADLLYFDELEALQAAGRGVELIATVTREEPTRPGLRAGHIDRALLAGALDRVRPLQRTYVCGSNPFVETVTQRLVDLAVAPERIRTERYGG